MKGWLLSALNQRVGGKSLEDLLSIHANDWLIWEPGIWAPPSSKTSPLTKAAPLQSTAGEALCLALEGKPSREPVTLGRAESCDLVVNDGTLSAHHLSFHFDDYHWQVGDAGSKNGSVLDGQKLGSTPVTLSSGAHLQAGQVYFTYLVPQALWQRIKGQRLR